MAKNGHVQQDLLSKIFIKFIIKWEKSVQITCKRAIELNPKDATQYHLHALIFHNVQSFLWGVFCLTAYMYCEK